MDIRIARKDSSLPLPEYKTGGAVAFDLASREEVIIPARACGMAPANIVIEIPEGYMLLIAARSSLHKRGLMLANNVGILDQDYHGPEDEIRIALYNFTDAPVLIPRGDRIAQGMIVPIEKATWQETPIEMMGEKSRGGFGSTGQI
jgi:dUTP pyrophosphatase